MKTKNIKQARTALRWGLGLMLCGFGLFVTLVFLQVSPVSHPVVFWQLLMQSGFFCGVLGLFLILLVGLSFIPGALRLSRAHLQSHGQSYSNGLLAIGAGLVCVFIALFKAYAALLALGAGSNDDEDNNSPWSESVGNSYDIGSYEWHRSRNYNN